MLYFAREMRSAGLEAASERGEELGPNLNEKGTVRMLRSENFLYVGLELDDFLAAQDVPPEELKRYEDSLLNFYAVFRAAFAAGVADGTVRGDVDPDRFYRTISHAATALELKLLRGSLLPGDRLDDPEELHELLEMALARLKP